MMYPFMTLDDNTEIVHSDVLIDGKVKVYIEKPDPKDCFHRLTCYLPLYELEDVYGFNDDEVKKYLEIIKSTAHLIIEFAKENFLMRRIYDEISIFTFSRREIKSSNI